MSILNSLELDNLHHAYLLEGEAKEIRPEIIKLAQRLGIEVNKNQDFLEISVETFKVEDARNLKSLGAEKNISFNKKIFVISANSFLLDAQNILLKTFEEPTLDTHYFLIVPDLGSLLPTFLSRFYILRNGNKSSGFKQAEEFTRANITERIRFLKELLKEEDEEQEGLEGPKVRALKFLNNVETVLHQRFIQERFSPICFEQIFKVRKFLRQPGSSAKTLMESVALSVPSLR